MARAWISLTPRSGSCLSGLLLVYCLLLHVASDLQAAQQLTATIEPDVIRVGEDAELSLVFENCQPTTAPQFTAVPGLTVSFASRSTAVQINNGQQTVLLNLLYRVRATQAGEFTLPPIKASVSGSEMSTQPVKLRVLRPNEAAPQQAAGGSNQLAFLQLVVPKEEVFVGELVPLEIQLHYVSAQDIQMQPLAADGFTLGKWIQLPQRQAVVDGRRYAVIGLRSTVQATKAGELKLGPAECRLNLRVSLAQRRTGNQLLDDFFNDPFGGRAELRPARLVSDAKVLRVLPIPTEGAPASFTGAVGQYTFTGAANPTNVAVGEPVNLTLRVTGQGMLENIRLPSLDRLPDFQTYPPTSQVETTDQLGVEGTKTFQQVVVPQSLTVKEVPAIEFSWFDPDVRRFRTSRLAPIPLIVRPAAAAATLAAPPSGAGSKETSSLPKDIVGQKTRLGPLLRPGPALIARPWFLSLQAVPIAVFLGALLWRRRVDHLARNPRLVQQQHLRKLVAQGLQQLRSLATAGDGAGFHALVFRLLQEQLGFVLELPAASITESAIDEHLRPRNAPASLVSTLQELFHACNQARYAPSTSARDLNSQLPRVEWALAALRTLER